MKEKGNQDFERKRITRMVNNIALNQDTQKICFKPGYTRIWKNNYYLTRILVKNVIKTRIILEKKILILPKLAHTHTHTHTHNIQSLGISFPFNIFFIRLYSHWNHFYRKIYI